VDVATGAEDVSASASASLDEASKGSIFGGAIDDVPDSVRTLRRRRRRAMTTVTTPFRVVMKPCGISRYNL
jgi:hypothetical protein